MSWTLKRQLLIGCGLILVVGLVGLVVYGTYFYTPASCFDGIQNQNETGVDCGGVCALLCEAPNVSVVWARSVPVAPGVFHAVGLVRNPDTESRGDVTYEVSLFDSENILITRRTGSLRLNPGELAPFFEPNLVTGERLPTRTFIDILPGVFERAERTPNELVVRAWELDERTQRLTATVEYTGFVPRSHGVITAFVFNTEQTVIAASQTRIEQLLPRDRREVVFTWQEPFSEEVGRVDIMPQLFD